ncbi:hypothetical protein CsSME_00048256 [Camellia sinensis var. sinensis]
MGVNRAVWSFMCSSRGEVSCSSLHSASCSFVGLWFPLAVPFTLRMRRHNFSSHKAGNLLSSYCVVWNSVGLSKLNKLGMIWVILGGSQWKAHTLIVTTQSQPGETAHPRSI